MSNVNIFISYSHEDESFASEVLTHLAILRRHNVAVFWSDHQVGPGTEWTSDVKKAVARADLAIILVSSHYLSSDYIHSHELPALFRRAREHRIVLCPILVGPAHWLAVPELAHFEFLNDVARPLSTLRNRDEELAKISRRMYDLVMQISASKSVKMGQEGLDADFIHRKPDNKIIDGHVFLSHSRLDGDFAELLKLKLAAEGFSSWIDTDRLMPGVDWQQEIDESIKKCISLIAIMSPEARRSEYVTYEWAFAWGRDKYIIPIMIQETPLHPRLANLQYLDFTNRNARPWADLFAALRSKNT